MATTRTDDDGRRVTDDDVIRPRERLRLMGRAANEDGEEGPDWDDEIRHHRPQGPPVLLQIGLQ